MHERRTILRDFPIPDRLSMNASKERDGDAHSGPIIGLMRIHALRS
jgi:hypothetical protein